jgi:hypothetical protein
VRKGQRNGLRKISSYGEQEDEENDDWFIK